VTTASAYLTPADAGYPSRLIGRIGTPAIYVRGVAPSATPAVAIVGARAASHAGMTRAHAVARHLAERGVHVVSGGALGIDGAAHRGALAGGGTTTVVLGCGVNIAYPLRHASLFVDVLAHGGGLVSLVRPDQQPLRGMFPARNPVIAALADVVVIVEADVRSGSLSTARAGRALGRVVAAFPGSPGCDRLLAEGAALVESPADVSSTLAGDLRYPAPPVLDPIAITVRDAIEAGAVTVDDIVAATQLTVRAVVRAQATLALANISCTPERSAQSRRSD
jgi:DNA processing protein